MLELQNKLLFKKNGSQEEKIMSVECVKVQVPRVSLRVRWVTVL